MTFNTKIPTTNMVKSPIISPSPHIRDNVSTRRLMRDVIIALTPAFSVSFCFLGFNVLLITFVSLATCVGTEWLLQKYAMKTAPSINDLSAVVTGLILALNLPPSIPLYMVVLGAIFAIGVTKISFGGLGNNPFNPAIAGRIFLLISFPQAMTDWTITEGFISIDGHSGATPLAIMRHGLAQGLSPAEIMSQNNLSYLEMLFGQIGGSFGEISALALLAGFAYMLIRRTITWHIPITIFATVGVFFGLLGAVSPGNYADPLFHILTGGLMLGAIFMATDYVTSPMTKKGIMIYAAGIGLITCVIRAWGGYPEGISFAILIMNAVVPLIDRYVKPRRFGETVKA